MEKIKFKSIALEPGTRALLYLALLTNLKEILLPSVFLENEGKWNIILFSQRDKYRRKEKMALRFYHTKTI